jgi:phage-related protein
MSTLLTFPEGIQLPEFQGIQSKVSFRILETEFGDNYSQRAVDGINPRREEWALTWNMLPTVEKEVIVDFLDERAGWQAFYWTPPSKSTARIFTCKEYTEVPMWVGFWKLTATFRQQFDLPT